MDIIFIVASITDTLDGRISRSQGIVTKFGKIMDPLADKVLVYSRESRQKYDSMTV